MPAAGADLLEGETARHRHHLRAELRVEVKLLRGAELEAPAERSAASIQRAGVIDSPRQSYELTLGLNPNGYPGTGTARTALIRSRCSQLSQVIQAPAIGAALQRDSTGLFNAGAEYLEAQTPGNRPWGGGTRKRAGVDLVQRTQLPFPVRTPAVGDAFRIEPASVGRPGNQRNQRWGPRYDRRGRVNRSYPDAELPVCPFSPAARDALSHGTRVLPADG